MLSNLNIALALSTLAGLSTGIGGLIVIFIRNPSKRLLSGALGFSAGVMLTVSLADMLPYGAIMFVEEFGHLRGSLLLVAMIMIGMGLAMAANRLVPKSNVSEPQGKNDLRRLGLVTAVALCVHNFPEGIATFMSSYADLQLGLPLTVSVAIHNIPEGMAIAMPIFYGTQKKGKAVGYAFISGLSEPLGAVLTYLLLRPFMNELFLAGMFGIIVGLMTYIAFSELIPTALSYGKSKTAATGLLIGTVVMTFGISLMG